MFRTAKRLGRFALLTLAGCALLPSAASAHFVWVEPAPGPDSVKVCFGEYPAGREGSPLLEKIERVRVHALGAGARRELKSSKQMDHYLFAGMGRAPVAVALLDYGVLERPGTQPFMLRYEAQLIRGEGKPLSAVELEKWSRVETGLPLAASLSPAAGGKLALQVTLDGKPVQAEVTQLGATEEKVKTSPDGRLEIPLAKGWQQLRIMAQDTKPARFEGKEGQFTRTYLSLMFEAAGAGPSAAEGDPIRILSDAHEARARWGKDFPGFTADAAFELNGRSARGKITVTADYQIRYELGNKELEAALQPSFASLIMHRRGGNPTYQATWKDSAAHPLGRAINLNDELKSFYRVRDRQILQVNRSMGSQRFTNNVFENEETKLGFLPRFWNVAYYDNATNALLRVSTTRVTWAWNGDVFMPATLDTVNVHAGGTDVSKLVLTNHRLLK